MTVAYMMHRQFIQKCIFGVALLMAANMQILAAAVVRAPGGGAVRAVVIGIDRYPNLPPNAQLAGAVADALDISGALTRAGAGVQTLTDGAATRSRVVGEMSRLVDESKTGDLVIITYSGHGMKVRAYPQWRELDASGANAQIALSRYGRSGNSSHEIVVDREWRAWFSRFDAKGVDVLVVMDACYGGAMREVVALAGDIRVRSLPSDDDEVAHDSFIGIPMSQREARANVRELSHVTFLAGATEMSVVPEMPGIDRDQPKAVRGALSYFVARSIEGLASHGGDLTRERLFKFLAPNIRQATNERQFIDFEPRTASSEALQKIVFRLSDGIGLKPDTGSQPDTVVRPAATPPADPVRVAIVNGPEASFSKIEKSLAPFVKSGLSEADLVWDVAKSRALSRGDLIMEQVDGSLLGAVVDRTWAIGEIKKLSQLRVLNVRMREDGKSYQLGDQPELLVGEIRNSYLTVVNIAADGTIQMLFPVHTSHDPHILTEQWTYLPVVDAPFGADHIVAVATTSPASELVAWLKVHNSKRDAALLPAIIARTIEADKPSRIGTVGLYTTP